MIYYSACPVCGSTAIKPCLQAKDHTASNETFSIWQCDQCALRFTQNVPSQDSIGKYYKADQYISHTDTKEGITNKLYHLVRSITLSQKRKLIQKISGLSQGNLLDVGAGTGFFVHSMQKAGWKVTGLEPSADARVKAASMGIDLKESSELFSLPPASFDIITLWHVLEHVHDLHGYMVQFKKLLKPAGRLMIAVPNYTSADAQHYKEYWAAYDVPRHLYHFSPASMKVLLEKHGLNLLKLYPQWFDSFYVSLLSEQYETGKTNMLKGGWEGLWSNVKAMRRKERCSSLIYVGDVGY